MRIAISVLVMMLAAVTAQSQEPRNTPQSQVDVTAGQDAAEVNYLTTSPFAQIPSDFDYGATISDNRDLVGSVAWLLHTNIQPIPRLHLNIGPEGYLAKLAVGNSGAFAVAASGNVRYELIRQWGISLYGGAAYAPHVLMFGSADNLTDFTAGVEVRFTPRWYALGGYRWFNFKFPAGVPDDRIENTAFAGLRWDLQTH